MKNCVKCGAEVNEEHIICNHCGCYCDDTFVLTIERQNQLFLINPGIKLSIDNQITCDIDNAETKTFSLKPGVHEILFSSQFREKLYRIGLDKPKKIWVTVEHITLGIDIWE